ncbi:porin family protein [Thalassobellus sediminis]|uniref:porin family protein n=1 Tax=Thalassobellus sediminis TaxID=3367753 RepID=UPI0037A9E06C
MNQNLKTNLIGIILIFLTFNLYGQDKIITGINTGLTYSDFRGNRFFENFDSELNYLIGVSIDFKISEKLFLSTDLNYEKKSVKLFYPESNVTNIFVGTPIGEAPKPIPDLKFQTKFQYFSIPIMVKYFFGKNLEFYVNGGPFLSYLLDVKNIDDGNESDLDFNDSFNKTDFGLTFGFGYNFEIDENNSISIELRDNYGINDNSKSNNSNFSSTKSNSVNLILNWDFKL